MPGQPPGEDPPDDIRGLRVGLEAAGPPSQAAWALFGCGPASPSRYPYGGRPPRYRPCSRTWTAIAVRTRMLVRVTSRFDDNPRCVIVSSSCSDPKSTRPPAAGGRVDF